MCNEIAFTNDENWQMYFAARRKTIFSSIKKSSAGKRCWETTKQVFFKDTNRTSLIFFSISLLFSWWWRICFSCLCIKCLIWAGIIITDHFCVLFRRLCYEIILLDNYKSYFDACYLWKLYVISVPYKE